jgi:hypothetical protein
MSNIIMRVSKYMLDRSVAPAVRYIVAQGHPKILSTALWDLAKKRAIVASLHYAEERMPDALILKTRVALWDYALKKICVTGMNAEFGVYKGHSINYFAKKLSVVYGFDSFEGLQEDWKGWEYSKGKFNLQGKLPRVARNVHLIKGWFDKTVPEFLAQHEGPFSFVHIDCDTFEATQAVLKLIGPRLVPGTVMVFDEYFGYRGWEFGEFKAWSEYVQRTGTEYKYLAFSEKEVALQIQHVP